MKALSWLIAIALTYWFQSGGFKDALNGLVPPSQAAIAEQHRQVRVYGEIMDLIRLHQQMKLPYDEHFQGCLDKSGYTVDFDASYKRIMIIDGCLKVKP